MRYGKMHLPRAIVSMKKRSLTGQDDLRWKYQRYVKTYAASVKSMDRQIGRLLDYLEANGLMENTIVLYSSDQGFFLGENGWFDKRWMDEVSSQVPLLIEWQGHIKPGSTSDALVQNIDFAPTLLAAAGVTPKTPMHGVSLLPLFEDNPKPWDRDLYYHFYENPGFHGVARHYGVRTDRYKLVYYYQNDEWELFDLVTDPQDQVNLLRQTGLRRHHQGSAAALAGLAGPVPGARDRPRGAVVPRADDSGGREVDDVVMTFTLMTPKRD